MHRSVLTGQRLVAAFGAGCLLFNYPLLSLSGGLVTADGFPLLFVYVFAVWAGLIGFMAWIIERKGD